MYAGVCMNVCVCGGGGGWGGRKTHAPILSRRCHWPSFMPYIRYPVGSQKWYRLDTEMANTPTAARTHKRPSASASRSAEAAPSRQGILALVPLPYKVTIKRTICAPQSSGCTWSKSHACGVQGDADAHLPRSASPGAWPRRWRAACTCLTRR
jgi:hypothetical protein